MAVLEKTVRICNRRGLHARAAAKFVRLAEHEGAVVTVIKDSARVCGTSIMGLLMLAASLDSSIRILVEGENAEEVLAALVALVESRFGEDE